MKRFILTALTLSLALPANAIAQKMQSDNGDGTYTNPVIAADFPDPDVILVDSTYYMVNTTMFVFPGVTLLKSHDLVNWEYCCNAVPRFDFSPCYDLDGCNRYGHGQWATSLKHHNGKFYLLFITLDEGGFFCTATKPEGPWQIRKLPKGFYDPGLFFDDDGRIYVAHGYNKIHVTELDTNFAPRGNSFPSCPQTRGESMKPRICIVAVGILLSAIVGGCKPAAMQQAEENKQVFLRSIDAINQKNFEALDGLATVNFVRHCQATPDVKVNSYEDFKNYLRQDAATFPDSRMTIDHVVAEGNFVAFHGTYVATQKGPMGPFPPSNKQMSIEIAGVQRFENGKVAEMWVTWDNLAALGQLGYFPPPRQQSN